MVLWEILMHPSSSVKVLPWNHKIYRSSHRFRKKFTTLWGYGSADKQNKKPLKNPHDFFA